MPHSQDRYNTAAIRKLLTAAFNDQEFTNFCFDHFRPVYEQFGYDMGRLLKIQLLIDHCERRDQFEELLNLVKEINLKQYNNYIPLIGEPTHIAQVGRSSGRSQVEIIFNLNPTPELQEAAIRALAAILNIPLDQINVVEARSGSIVLRLEMPTETVNQLIDFYEAGDPIIQDLGIQEVRVIHKQSPQPIVSVSRSFHEKSQRADLQKIRTLLTEGFTDEELRYLCYDVPDFRPIYDQLARSTGKAEIVQRLIEHADRKLQLETLLALAKKRNPARYKEHQPYYEIEDIEGAWEKIKGVVPPDNPALNTLADGLKRLADYHEILNEWKELHNLLQEIIVSFDPFVGQVDELFVKKNKEIDRRRLKLQWNRVRMKIEDLTDFGRYIQHIGSIYRDDGTNLTGERWIIDIIEVANHLEANLLEGNRESLYDSTKEFSSICNHYLYYADKKLRDIAGYLYNLSTVLRGIGK